MSERMIIPQYLNDFKENLLQEEKSAATVEKYLRDVRTFFDYTEKNIVDKEITVSYKNHLLERNYAASSINSMLASLNSFLEFMGWEDCKVKHLKRQRQTYCSEDKELTKIEYQRLLTAAKDQEQLKLVIETICSTGIRISELQYFTIEALKKGKCLCDARQRFEPYLYPRHW